jgi:four helix bundle protein
MTYDRFEDLPVWKAAQDLGVEVYALVRYHPFTDQGDLRDQLRRASLSISNNIAEGFERGSTSELLMFLYIARGSAGETRSALRFANRLAERGLLGSGISDLRSQIRALIPHCESISRQLRKWADHLQSSDIKGPRHLNDAARNQYDQTRRLTAFEEKLRQIRENAARAKDGDGTPSQI